MHSLLKKNLTLSPEPIFPPFTAILKGADVTNPVQLTCFLITAKEKASGFFAFQVPADRDLTTGQDFHLLGSLGNFLGGAIENARLNKTLQKHREELKGLTARLFHSQELERRRIARELHDEAGQALTGINFALETIEKSLSPEVGPSMEYIAEIKKQINRTYEEMRRISYSLHPTLLTDLGLEPALDSYLTNISKYRRLAIDFKMVGFEERLDPEIETILYRISQEVLTNTLKHAKAKHFIISIIKSYPYIIFLAEDDGVGFDPGEFDENKQALGLLSMRERADMLGGKFSLRTSKGKGTRIRIEIPMKESLDD
jgi:signal transduction histidine kinase